MAYKTEPIKTSSHSMADYWKLADWSVDELLGSARATFRLFLSEDAAKDGAGPADHRVAKLRLDGADFVTYFGPDRDPSHIDLRAALYAAAADLGVISDFGEQPNPTCLVKRLFKAELSVIEDKQKPGKTLASG